MVVGEAKAESFGVVGEPGYGPMDLSGLVSAKVEKWGKAYLSIEEEAWWVSRVLESTGRAVDRESRDSRDRIAL